MSQAWPISDPLGSVAAQVNSASVATQINRYDEYGVPQAGFSGRFGYAGAMFLERGVAAPWHMRNRQYNPTLGRFMQTDPIGYADGMNLYAYVGGDPVNRIDPWGLQDNPTVVDEVQVTGRRIWWLPYNIPWRGFSQTGAGWGFDENLNLVWFVDDVIVVETRAEHWSCQIPPVTIGIAADRYRWIGFSVAYNLNVDLGRGQIGFTTSSGVGVGAGSATGFLIGVVARSDSSGGASVNLGGSVGGTVARYSHGVVYNALGTDPGLSQVSSSRGGLVGYANLQVNAGLRAPALWGHQCP